MSNTRVNAPVRPVTALATCASAAPVRPRVTRNVRRLICNRHCNLRIGVEEGRINLIDEEVYPRPRGAPETIRRDVWEGALKAAREVERRYGKKKLGPWDDFEWGMVNGKLSALRWALGDEWDMLDT